MAQQRGPDAVKVAQTRGSDTFAAVPSVRSALLNPGRGATKPSGRTLQHLMRSMAIPAACDSSRACPGALPGATWKWLAGRAAVCLAIPAVSMCSMHLAGRHRLPETAAGLKHIAQTFALKHLCADPFISSGLLAGRGPGLFGALAQSEAGGSHAGAAAGADNVGLEDLLSSLNQTAPVAAPAPAATG